MTFLPVVAREMSVLSRRRSTYIARAATAFLAMLVIGWLLLVAISGFTVTQLGKTIFVTLSVFSFGYALLVGIHSTSDCISEEKREGTLGLLFLTDLKSYDVVLGKLTASSLSAVYALAGVIPMLAIAMLLGGVSFKEVGMISLVLANTMFLSLALGMLASAISVNERKAVFTAAVAMFLITVAPFIIFISMMNFQFMPAQGFWLSPLYPILCVMLPVGKVPGFDMSYFKPALVVQHLLAWLFLFRATNLLPSFIHGETSRRVEKWKTRFDQYVFGNFKQRKEHRATLLDRNAFLWLAGRERAKPVWAWVVVGVFALLYLWVGYGFQSILFELQTSIAIIFLVHLVLKVWWTSEVCTRLIEDRRSGALELLLSSPLSVPHIAAGQHLALRRIFGKPVLALIIAEICLMFISLSAFTKPSPADRVLTYLAGITTLLLDLWALKWVALWLSLFGKSSERVLIATMIRILVLPALTFVAVFAPLSAVVVFAGRRLEFREILALWWLCSIVYSMAFVIPARRNFFRYFREIAANRYEHPSAVLNRPERPSPKKVRGIPTILRERPVFATLGVAAVLAFLAIVSHRLYWQSHLQQKIAAVRSQNHPTKLLEIPAFYKPVENKKNAFGTLLNAGPINSLPNWSILNRAGSSYLRGLPEDERQQFEIALSNNAKQFEAFLQLPGLTNAYISPLPNQHYVTQVDFHGYLNLALGDLMLAATERDSARMERNLNATLAYIGLLRNQPLQHPQLFAGIGLRKLNAALEGIFFQDSLSDEALRRLQQLLSQIDKPEVARQSLAITRALVLDMKDLPKIAGQSPNPYARQVLAESIGAYQKQMTRVLSGFEAAFDYAAREHHVRYRWATNLPQAQFVSGVPDPSIETMINSHIRDTVIHDLQVIAAARILVTATAIHRYQQKRSTYPATLEELIPEFLSSVPGDPFTETALRWNVSSNRASLFSSPDPSKEIPPPNGISFRFYPRPARSAAE